MCPAPGASTTTQKQGRSKRLEVPSLPYGLWHSHPSERSGSHCRPLKRCRCRPPKCHCSELKRNLEKSLPPSEPPVWPPRAKHHPPSFLRRRPSRFHVLVDPRQILDFASGSAGLQCIEKSKFRSVGSRPPTSTACRVVSGPKSTTLPPTHLAALKSRRFLLSVFVTTKTTTCQTIPPAAAGRETPSSFFFLSLLCERRTTSKSFPIAHFGSAFHFPKLALHSTHSFPHDQLFRPPFDSHHLCASRCRSVIPVILRASTRPTFPIMPLTAR